MQRRLAASGVWVEPASAAGLAGLAHQLRAGKWMCAASGWWRSAPGMA
jgi:threonine synthase